MYNSNIPTDRELPSTKQLIKSTIIAAATAGVLLTTVVLPAEYGLDPTGVGNMLGLKKMGEIKVSLAEEVKADQQADAAKAIATQPKAQPVELVSSAQAAPIDTVSITLVPNEGKEVKAVMRKGETVTYEWASTGGKVNFDVHGDSTALNIDYHNYEKGSEKVKVGSLTAAFDGNHGWFWRNRTSELVTVTLKVSGDYEKLIQVK